MHFSINKFSKSYGLIVKTKCNRVVLIRRKVPYCVQNFYYYLDKINYPFDENVLHPFSSPSLQKLFETYWFPKLTLQEQNDYLAFQNHKIFEDLYDFPHGQLVRRRKKTTTTAHRHFISAYREFEEETGFRFRIQTDQIARYPLLQFHFNGRDGHQYTQYYFVIENVSGLRRFRYFDNFENPAFQTTCKPKLKNWKDDRLVYEGKLLHFKEAYKWLKRQQILKRDDKHLAIQPERTTFLEWR